MIVIPGWMAILISCILIALIIAFCATICYCYSIDKSNDELLKFAKDVLKVNEEVVKLNSEIADSCDKQTRILSDEIKLLKSLVGKNDEIVDIHGKQIETLKSLINVNYESIKKISNRIMQLELELEKSKYIG